MLYLYILADLAEDKLRLLSELWGPSGHPGSGDDMHPLFQCNPNIQYDHFGIIVHCTVHQLSGSVHAEYHQVYLSAQCPVIADNCKEMGIYSL